MSAAVPFMAAFAQFSTLDFALLLVLLLPPSYTRSYMMSGGRTPTGHRPDFSLFGFCHKAAAASSRPAGF